MLRKIYKKKVIKVSEFKALSKKKNGENHKIKKSNRTFEKKKKKHFFFIILR